MSWLQQPIGADGAWAVYQTSLFLMQVTTCVAVGLAGFLLTLLVVSFLNWRDKK